MSEALPERVRVRFTKQGKVRFTSHRDVARMFERALRRSALPVAWSEGFSPRPLLSFGLALPTGCESLAEYLDVKLEAGAPAAGPEGDPVALDNLPGLLTPLLPEGVAVVAAGPVPVGAGSLQQEVTSCTWELEVFGVSPEELAIYVERLLDAPSLHNSAVVSPIGVRRTVSLDITGPIAAVSRGLGLSHVVGWTDEAFGRTPGGGPALNAPAIGGRTHPPHPLPPPKPGAPPPTTTSIEATKPVVIASTR